MSGLDEKVAKTSLQRSEIMVPMGRDGHVTTEYRDVTFDDLFRETFRPLDSRKKVGNYVLGRTIGEGSFSKVRLGKHVETNEKVAIKVLPKKTILKRHDARRRFYRETKSLRLLLHQNIVRLYDVMETSGNYYLVMELVGGENFKDYLTRRIKLEENETKMLLYQIATAVHYMHSQGIIHRDLKPENFILQESTIRIVDFGLSACVAQDDTMATQCGSPAYAAPEIFNKQPYNQSVDVWSIGVILYLVLTGGLPYKTNGGAYTQLYLVILRGYDIPQSLSTECQSLISQLLQVDPSLRITTSDMLRHPWLSSVTSGR